MGGIGSGRKPVDLTGQQFGRWTVLAYAGESRWTCRCDCGEIRDVFTAALHVGSCHGSCGCSRQRHGHKRRGKRSRVYSIYRGIVKRCYYPRSVGYENYGGRGIVMCERWRGADGFVHFLEDMGEPPPRHEIDRTDNDGNYEPGNCRWVTGSDNRRNRRQHIHRSRSVIASHRDDIRDLRNAGLTIRAIADVLRLDSQTVSGDLRALGLRKPR
jgi:hypothetical protein